MMSSWLPKAYRNSDRLEQLLAVWLGLSAIMAFSSAAMCCFEPNIIWERIYLNVNVKSLLCGSQNALLSLLARVSGLFSLLMALLRLACAADIRNKRLYQLTMAGVAISIAHYLTEIYYYNTVVAEMSSAIPIFLNVLTLLGMIVMHCRMFGTFASNGGDADGDTDPAKNYSSGVRHRATRRNVHNDTSD